MIKNIKVLSQESYWLLFGKKYPSLQYRQSGNNLWSLAQTKQF